MIDYSGIIYHSGSSNDVKFAIILMPLNKPFVFDMSVTAASRKNVHAVKQAC
jgi:hypothetical protein